MMVALILLSLLSLTGSLFYIVAAALTYQFFTPSGRLA